MAARKTQTNGQSGKSAGDANRELFALYGAIDRAITESDGKIGPTVDRYLPRYSANTGWYPELERYLFGDDAREAPDLETALTGIAEADAADNRLRQPQKFRLLYGLSTVAKLQSLPECPLPSLTSRGIRDLAVAALAAAGPSSATPADRLDTANTTLDEFTARNPKNIGTFALNGALIGEQTADTPLCSTAPATVGGLRAVRITTSARSDRVTFDNVKRIVNPYNWDDSYREFFVKMAKPPKPTATVRPDSWRRVIEHVSFLGALDVVTPLKFYPDESQPGVASIDYDLDTSILELGDGRVLVDKGFMNIKVANDANDPTQPGVSVNTCKIVRLDGISTFAQERLVCLTGYGTASADLVFGRAEDPPKRAEEFLFPTDEPQADATDVADTPVAPPRHAVPAASQLWIDTLQDLTGDYAKLAEQWWDGTLTLPGVARHYEQVGGKLFRAPFTYLDLINRSRYRAK